MVNYFYKFTYLLLFLFIGMFGSVSPYQPPSWLQAGLTRATFPTHKLQLGRFPTPLHPVTIPGLEGCEAECFFKRDDLSSFDLSGNKVRKLEFLLADAISKKHDSIITVGGVQSNHCRATAVAARQVGLEPYLILRRPTGSMNEPLALTGNLLLDRMVDAKIYTVSTGTYSQVGSDNLCCELASQLKSQGKNPYVIPVGGSNGLGAFGYIECIREILDQGIEFDHIIFACGSGGTAAGLVIGAKLANLKARIHAIGVCDSPEYFYNHIEEVAVHHGVDFDRLGPVRGWCNIYAGEGIGYARSTEDELKYLIEVGKQTGVVLDPVYSGKALYHFVNHVVRNKKDLVRPGEKILFIHTGGTLGLYDKETQILPLLPSDQVQKLEFTTH